MATISGVPFSPGNVSEGFHLPNITRDCTSGICLILSSSKIICEYLSHQYLPRQARLPAFDQFLVSSSNFTPSVSSVELPLLQSTSMRVGLWWSPRRHIHSIDFEILLCQGSAYFLVLFGMGFLAVS